MKKILLLIICAVILPLCGFAQQGGIQGTWKVVKVKTSDEGLNALLQVDKTPIHASVTFAKAKVTIAADKEKHTADYMLNGKELTVSGISWKDFAATNSVTLEAETNADSLKIIMPVELTRQMALSALKVYTKQTGESFLTKMMEATITTSDIRGIAVLKRK